MRSRLWLIIIIGPLILTTFLGQTIILPLSRATLQILGFTFSVTTLVLALIVHEITRRFVTAHGVQREANFIIRASMRRGLFDGLFLLNTAVFLSMALFFVFLSPLPWVNYWMFMMVGATVVLSINLSHDYGIWKHQKRGV